MRHFYIFSFLLLFLLSCGDRQWKGQGPIERVSTESRPIQYQLKKTFPVGNGIYLSNEFDGARLNGVILAGKNEVTTLITPENTPVNSSPWYAFKIWSETPQNIRLKITYSDGVSHRYRPKISNDGKNWNEVADEKYHLDSVSIANDETPKFCVSDLTISPDTTWVAAQELIVSKDIDRWTNRLSEKPDVSDFIIGKSSEGKNLMALEIGNSHSKRLLMILSRQHPPEVTGWLAMKAFVERLCTEDSLALNFRKNYLVYVVPCMNPDGVDLGNWRHSAAGVDLNRDWEDFRQPETQSIRKFMQNRILKGDTFFVAIDFHSTFEDIYYTHSPKLKGNLPGFVPKLIKKSTAEIPDYKPNIRPDKKNAVHISSSASIFHAFHAEAFTYEVGDDTPRDQIKMKGEATARSLMELLLTNDN